MGGGPEAPVRDSQIRRELLLAVLPWPEEQAAKSIADIKREFPNLDVHYIHEKYDNKAERGKTEVPKGKQWASVSINTPHHHSFVALCGIARPAVLLRSLHLNTS